MHPQMVERQIARLRQRPDFGVVYTGWQLVDARGAVLAESRPRREGDLLRELLLRRLGLTTIGVAAIRRECLERAGLFDESLAAAEIFDLWLRLASSGVCFGAVAEPLFRYRLHADSLTGAAVGPEELEARAAVLRRFFSTPGLGPDVRALQGEALGIARLENAVRCFRQRDAHLGRTQLELAAAAFPPLFERPEFLEILAAGALDPRTQAPGELIDALIDGLPASGRRRRRLRRRAHGRYHCAAAFSAHGRGDRAAVRAHTLRAVLWDPALALNRGLLSIGARALSS
jgi:hypothetical protein